MIRAGFLNHWMPFINLMHFFRGTLEVLRSHLEDISLQLVLQAGKIPGDHLRKQTVTENTSQAKRGFVGTFSQVRAESSPALFFQVFHGKRNISG